MLLGRFACAVAQSHSGHMALRPPPGPTLLPHNQDIFFSFLPVCFAGWLKGGHTAFWCHAAGPERHRSWARGMSPRPIGHGPGRFGARLGTFDSRTIVRCGQEKPNSAPICSLFVLFVLFVLLVLLVLGCYTVRFFGTWKASGGPDSPEG